tara:strand:- start:229 stop:582 length:354 start_codon:yes stop_codon:yes gene_type:complete
MHSNIYTIFPINNNKFKLIDTSKSDGAVLEKLPDKVLNRSPKYRVLLHNDPVNTMDYVVNTLRQVLPQLSEQDAISIMLETHNCGIGLVIVCDIEPAEFYSESLNSKGLTSTIEREG